MKRLIALIALRCADLQTLQQLETDEAEMEKKRHEAIRLKKAEVRWLVKEHMRFNVEIDFGASGEGEVTVNVPADELTVTFKPSFVSDRIIIQPRFKKRGRHTVSLIDMLQDLMNQVPEGVPDNLVTA